ncbi:hypothetical protein [Phenylobacterium sp.]|uniref:hypothetical protein n=1 Tax=Phenylobacterium sp. TaxID=1871053 RepID=UPI00289B2A7A|nr:hypothetical protein [Phenylobacterium sp.]
MTGASTEAGHREPRILFALTPFPDESFFGFVSRLATWNHVNSSREQFFKGVGLLDLRNHGMDAAIEDAGPLAWRLRLTTQQLGALVARDDPELHLYRKQISLAARRVSPSGLKVAAYHRAAWTSKLPFCAQSWDILIERCPGCQKTLGWSTLRIELCERCGFDLRAAATSQIPETQHQTLSALAALIDRDAEKRLRPAGLPAALSTSSTFQVFALALALARTCASAFHGTKFAKLSPVEKAAHMAAGLKILLNYPASFEELTSQKNARLPDFFRIATLHMGLDVGPLFDRLYSDWQPNRHGPSRLRRERELRGQLTLRGAASKLRIENRDLRRLIDCGLINAHGRRGTARIFQWLDPGEICHAARRLDGRMSIQEFSRTFKMPSRGVSQLVNLGLLDRNRDPMVTELHASVQLCRSSVVRLVRRLQAVSQSQVCDVPALALEDVFHGIGAQEKPWAPILRAADMGQIKLYYDHEGSEYLQIRKLQISRALADEILAGQRSELLDVSTTSPPNSLDETMTRVDAEDYLNCFPRDLSWLLAEGVLSSLQAVEVIALGGEVISSREISWRWRVSPEYREGLTKRHGIERIVGPFWSRAAVEAHFAAHFPFGRPS